MNHVDHILKTVDPYFSLVWAGFKWWDFRDTSDRHFEKDQTIILKYHNPIVEEHTLGMVQLKLQSHIQLTLDQVLEDSTMFGSDRAMLMFSEIILFKQGKIVRKLRRIVHCWEPSEWGYMPSLNQN